MAEREWINSAYLEVLARRQTGESTLARLIALAEERHRYGAVSCTAARLLAQHFSSLSDIATRLSLCVDESDDAFEHRSPGVLGHYVLGWPNGNLAMSVNENLQSLLPRLSILDQLLVAVATKNVAAAEKAVVAMLSRRFSSWAYRSEEVQAIRIWMHSGMASESADAWLTSGEGNLAATALSILGETGGSDLWERAALVKRFNGEVTVHAVPPGDGVDAADGRHTSWAVRMYAALDDARAR